MEIKNIQDILNWIRLHAEHHYVHSAVDAKPPQAVQVEMSDLNKIAVVLQTFQYDFPKLPSSQPDGE
tara:strand:- start:1572 stop:1772 length:201 start_codon:yes stop_codon:yes gene_type:complete